MVKLLDNDMFGISKQSYNDKTDCWLIRLFYKDGKPQYMRSIPINRGRLSLVMAKGIRDKILDNAIENGYVPNGGNIPRHQKRNRSGVSGLMLSLCKSKGSKYFVFKVSFNTEGKVNSRSFGVNCRGWLPAFEMALRKRIEKEQELYGYSLLPPIKELDTTAMMNRCLLGYKALYPELLAEDFSKLGDPRYLREHYR